ncbi:small GTP-binding protein [Solidesulfovibrio carbinoliphilus subsp. oakridgensis]|uniref:Small GTP-binding protein n=1 Tax=Solidesulfovibrio carbinoliphilus subsp. oakridgensis TaxID=694327 RepID=G7Q8I8_9BACT|nr:[FeFe] hydrogenase H-cluster maturation GTPase HydF [Solidesulfovibrio carbinoliphilus]EHJ48600.1 small GTP-binding protein [Solidesulfovibrio carbinoliphilus subsp. oakridgensis]
MAEASETKAPRGVRLVITLVGRTNAGKSSLLNAMTGQDVAIVSDVAGTTTDPVAKAYELLPLGPVTFYDTAGLDDTGELGALRMAATKKVLWRTDIAVVVAEAGPGLTEAERAVIADIRRLDVPFLVVFNKTDLASPPASDLAWCRDQGIRTAEASAATGQGAVAVKEAIMTLAPAEALREPVLAGDLFGEGDTVVCVVPIDLAAPKGRLILPQVQVLREILDGDAVAVTVKERELEAALGNLRRPPALVVTDSQVILKVSGDVPDDVPLTTFSTLFARYKGDLPTLAAGAQAIDKLRDGDTVLMAEACSHHVQADDIGRVKIPRWIGQYTGRDLHFEMHAGHDFPDDLERFALVIHCGSCMLGRMEMLRRIKECVRRGVPVTNYGVAISKVQGVLDRVLRPVLR